MFYETSRSDKTDCYQHGEYTNVYICDIRDLEPGTLHQFEVISKNDGERGNVSVRTGKRFKPKFVYILIYFNLINNIIFQKYIRLLY